MPFVGTSADLEGIGPRRISSDYSDPTVKAEPGTSPLLFQEQSPTASSRDSLTSHSERTHSIDRGASAKGETPFHETNATPKRKRQFLRSSPLAFRTNDDPFEPASPLFDGPGAAKLANYRAKVGRQDTLWLS